MLPSFHLTFHSGDESPFTCDLTPNYVDEYPNVFNPPPQPPVYSCEFCGNDAHYGHYCTPQAPFIYPEPCYNQDINFPQDFHNFPQQYPCCDDCEVTHEAYQCQPMNEDYYHGKNSCYDSTSIGGIDDDILLTIKDDILREKLLNVNLLIAKIEALNANPTPSSNFKTKSSSTSLNSLFEETNTFDNSLPEFETFCFDVE
nr:hypothetical protein [Tanacetum cinerariifolium]